MGRVSFLSHSSEESRGIAKNLAHSLKPGAWVFFYGDLGVGKTTFIAALVEELTGIDQATSPTFSYAHRYEGKNVVAHFDLYRLSDEKEFFAKGLDESMLPNVICCIEWSERLITLPNSPCWKVFMRHEGEGKRSIEIEYDQ